MEETKVEVGTRGPAQLTINNVEGGPLQVPAGCKVLFRWDTARRVWVEADPNERRE